VATISTAQLLTVELKASRVARSGEITMRPGELPAPISPPLTRVSISPSMISRPGKAVGLETLCEATTRVVNRVDDVVDVLGPAPQQTRLKPATTSRGDKNATLFRSNFKRQAPNNMKDGDLGAKERIIADQKSRIIRS
jgi:hypothetical protein